MTEKVQQGVIPANASLVEYRREFIARCLAYRIEPSTARAESITGLISFLRTIGSVSLAQSYRDTAQRLCGTDLYAQVPQPGPATDAVGEVADAN